MARSSRPWLEQQVRQAVRAGLRIAVVVPCYNVQDHIARVVQTMPSYVRDVILVDDASQDETRAVIAGLRDDRIQTIQLGQNAGVGGAVLAGFAKACALGADVVVKMDGDGQMDPHYLPYLVVPLITGKADYTKGNRFRSGLSLAQMPMVRRLGNAVLSFFAKVASGYWNIFDPTNGYIATRREIVELLPVELIDRRYFFESSLLIALGILGAVVRDIPMDARYGVEKSHLHIGRVILEFPLRFARGFLRRVWLQKILYSLTMEAVLGIAGLVLLLAGTAYGITQTIDYGFIRKTLAPSGTVMAAALLILLGFQMLLNAVLLDVQAVPAVPLCDKFIPDAEEGSPEGKVPEGVGYSGLT